MEFLDRQFAATAQQYSFGAIARIDPDGRTVSLRLDAGKSATVGSKLIVLQDRAYAARVRVTAVDAGAPQAVVEHLEPGVSIAPGDLVWDRSP